MLKESDILFEVGNYWVCRALDYKGYEVYRNGITHSRRVAIIGWDGEKGLERAISEAKRRHEEKPDIWN